MKKLITMFAIGMTAIAVHAGAASWGSGAFYVPNADGSLSDVKLTSASTYTSVVMYLWESNSAAFDFDDGDLYKWYADGAKAGTDPFGGTSTALTTTKAPGSSSTSISQAGTVTAAAGDPLYCAVLYVLKDSKGDVYYMENEATVAAKSGTTKAPVANLANYVGGGTEGTATKWVAAPEPTSGLLLLLGMAGLALRRRRA